MTSHSVSESNYLAKNDGVKPDGQHDREFQDGTPTRAAPTALDLGAGAK